MKWNKPLYASGSIDGADIGNAAGKIDAYAHELAEAHARRIAADFEENILDEVQSLGSPIEQLMGLALQYALFDGEWYGSYGFDCRFGRSLSDIMPGDGGFPPPAYRSPEGGIWIWPQAPIGKYRADFYVQFGCNRARGSDLDIGYVEAAIECDGHAHHDLTKEQAQHDRERDREFQSRGLIILRYPGSQIWRAPLKCAVDALAILERRAQHTSARRAAAR